MSILRAPEQIVCRVGAKGPAGIFLSVLVVALVPKCPACLLAYVSALGLGFGAASFIVDWAQPVVVVLGSLALVLTVRRVLSPRRQACGHGASAR